MSKRSARCF